MTVISARFGEASATEEERTAYVDAQKGWLVLSSRGTQTVADTGHAIEEEDFPLVRDAIFAVLDAAREALPDSNQTPTP